LKALSLVWRTYWFSKSKRGLTVSSEFLVDSLHLVWSGLCGFYILAYKSQNHHIGALSPLAFNCILLHNNISQNQKNLYLDVFVAYKAKAKRKNPSYLLNLALLDV
jgi:hypothetical protein